MTTNPIRDLPHNFEAEQALLGSIMVNNSAYHRVSEFLRGEHFADPMHGALFDSAAALIKRGQIASPFSLKAYIDSVPGLKEQGGIAYIARLTAGSYHFEEAESLGRDILDAAMRRGLIAIGTETMTAAYSPKAEDTAAAQIEATERKLYDLATGNTAGGFERFSAALTGSVVQAEGAHQRKGQLSGVTTGLKALDNLLGGLHPSDLVILAGRPSMGKTALATNIAVNAAAAFREEDGKTVDGAKVGFFSLEMSAEQVATRVVAEKSGISSDYVRKGKLTPAEFDRFLTAAKFFESLPMFIDDTGALSMASLRNRARRLQRQHGCDLLVIDYLQLITPDERRKNGNRVNEVSDITQGLKALAKELNIPVLALSQLSRAVESRTDKRPQLADLRDSGSIEQDADVVMFVYREQYYLERAGLPAGDSEDRAEVLIEKQRHGPIGNVKLKFEAYLTRFSDLEPR